MKNDLRSGNPASSAFTLLRAALLTGQFMAIFAAAPALLRAQTIIGGGTPDPSAIYEISGTDRSLLPPRMTDAQRDAILNPAKGLLIFVTDQNSLQVNIGTPASPNWLILEDSRHISSNGDAVVTTYGGPGCTGGSAIEGALYSGLLVEEVYMILYANVSQPGDWLITASQNGVNFLGSGTFTSTGCQPIVLVASGMPTNAGTFTWTTNSTPSTSVTATVVANPSTNVDADVLAYGGPECMGSASIIGSLVQGVNASNATLELYGDVAHPGAWSISAVQNGVTFSGSGIFTAAGCQLIVLNGSGAPTNAGSFTWTTNTTPAVSAAATVAVGEIAALNCASSNNNGILVHGVAASGVNSRAPYTGGNGGPHSGQTVTSTGVTGLTATLAAGTFAIGDDSLTYTISGTPSGSGTASFALSIGGQTCTLTREVKTGEIAALNCASSNNNGALVHGVAASGVNSRVPYTGGNGGPHSGQTVTSTGVTGLTATLTAGNFAAGADSLTYTITGTPAGSGTASFALNIGGQTCTLTRTVSSGEIAALNCASATNSGTLIHGAAASGVSSGVPYTGGNGGPHSGQTVTSTGVTGLTATVAAGTFAIGAESLSYAITGTPSDIGTASFALDIGGRTCTLTRTVAPGSITTLNCASAAHNGTLVHGVAASSVSSRVPYTGGNGGAHSGQTVTSTGITGLTATLTAGNFAAGADSLTYTITGTPSGSGTASFALNIGGQTCTLTRTVNSGEIAALNCASATNSGTLIHGAAASGVSSGVPYTGGNGGPHSGQTVTSTGVTGLTATAAAGTFAIGAGSLSYTITGTPSAAGTASFALNIGGQTCTLTREVAPGSITTLNCASATHSGSLKHGLAASGVSSGVPYTGGNGGAHSGQTVTSTGVTGLTATLAAGTFASGAGSLTYTIAGTPAGSGTASFALNIGGQTCTLTRTVASGEITALNCASATNNGTLVHGAAASGVSSDVPYTGGDGGGHSGQTVTSTGVTGLTATLAAGAFAAGAGSLSYTISGTPAGSGTASFALSIGGQSCTLTRTVAAGAITALNCASARNSGTLTANVSASGVNSRVPYTGGNGGAHSGQTVTSTGVTGLTATLAAGNFAAGADSLTYAITGTPSATGTASFALNIGGQSCTLTREVDNSPANLPAGAGAISGRTCFDIALSNDNTNNCAPLNARTAQQANFTQASTHTQTYLFTPSGTVSNVRFAYVNTNGSVIIAQSGGDSGNNISTPVPFTVNYNTNLNTLALGLTNSNPLTADIYAVYNDGATNNGTDRQIKITTSVKDCACCGAFVASGVWKQTMCHNLGAVQSADPFTPDWQLNGHYYQWGRNPSCFGIDGTDAANPCSSPVYGAAAPWGNTTANDNAGDISGWNTTVAATGAWSDGSKTADDPCPAGFRIPTKAQWDGVLNASLNTLAYPGSWSNNSTNYSAGLQVGQTLFIPATGGRVFSTGALGARGNVGYYWSSTESGSNVFVGAIENGAAGTFDIPLNNVIGLPVRCVADEAGAIGALNCVSATHSGVLINGVAASGVSSSVPYTGGNGGAYSAQSVTSTGVTGLTATLTAGTFATGAGSITLTISGTPSGTGTASFALNVGGQTCTLERAVVAPASFTALDCASATNSGTLTEGVAAFAVSSVPYTGGNGGGYNSQTVSSTGVTGLTATLATGTLASGAGSLTYNIGGTPSGTGTASFALSIGGQSCTLTREVSSNPGNLPVGAGALIGRSCFDLALSNNNTNNCAPLSARTARQADFTQSSTHTQTYTFSPSGTVSNVRFVIVNTNAWVIIAQSGGNSGNNITTPVNCTVNYNTNLNTLALGLTNTNPLTADIYAIYNDGPTNNGTDRQIKITASVKDCACCGAFVASGVWKEFMCHNLGAVQSADPFALSWQLNGNYYQWGRNPSCFGIDGTDAANPCSSPVYGAAAPWGNTTANDNAGAISGWNTTAAGAGAWLDGAKTANDPCPAGFRLPTRAQWEGVRNSSLNSITYTGSFTQGTTNYTSAMRVGQTLLLPAAGIRDTVTGSLGTLSGRGDMGRYWSSAQSGNNAWLIHIASFSSNMQTRHTSNGFSVRCVADDSGAIDALNCAGATNSGTLTYGLAASSVSSSVPYTGGNGGPHSGQSVMSTGVTGLTASVAAGALASGAGSLSYSITGTPIGAGTASFALIIGGKTCTLTREVGEGTISSLSCAVPTNNGTLVHGVAASGVSSTVSYTGGTFGAGYNSRTVNSTGVTGLTATLPTGTFVSSGDLTFTITGTPEGSGTASFAISIGGRSCTLTRTVNAGSITSLCIGPSNNIGTLIQGVPASGVSSRVPYTGGNGGVHNGQTVNSTGVTGLTATLTAGNFAVGADSLTYTITGTPSGSGTASFALSIGGRTCTLTRTVAAGAIASIDCASPTNSGALMHGVAASGVSSIVSYTGGNGGGHNGQTVTSTGVTGLTATLTSGNFASGAGSLTYTITGTPTNSGTASFALSIGGRTCTLTRTVNAGSIASIDCASASHSGTLVHGVAASSVSSSVPYTGGNGGGHNGQTVTSTGVTGLTATLTSGNFASGSGSLTYNITGTPTGSGTASFALSIGGQTCTLNRTVAAGAIASINCASASHSGTLVHGVAASSVSSSVPYTGGNGGSHSGQTVTSTGVTGLTATLTSGNFASGSGSLTYTITGTPDGSGTASFALSIGGQTCTLNRTVATGAIGAIDCASANNNGTLVNGVVASGVNSGVPYSGGNGGPHNGQTVTSTGVTGLTATLTAGNFASGSGSLTYTITGTPTGSGTAAFSLSIGGQNCTLNRTVAAGSITGITCASARHIGGLFANTAAISVSSRVPYAGGNGGAHSGQTVNSTGVTGLTATLTAGNFASGADSLTYAITGTPSGAGTASFALSIGGQTCTLTRTVGADPAGVSAGNGTLSGRMCFDLALGNNNTNGCAPHSIRTPLKADFTQAATHTQVYTFVPSGTVSNVRFACKNINGSAIISLSGGNSGNNISTAQSATINYNTNLNTLAAGLTNTNALTSDIYVIFNDGATNNGTDRRLKISARVHDCGCCGAYVATGDWREFMCHNLGADQSQNPFTPAWQLNGDYYQWGRNPSCFGIDGTDATNPCSNPTYGAAAPWGSTTSNDNAGVIATWSTTAASDGAWTDGSKTATDPCPTGFRVPTRAQWDVVVNWMFNTRFWTGTWSAGSTNYNSYLSIHPQGDPQSTILVLPAAGSRGSTNGSLASRNSQGRYWSSTGNTSPNAWHLNIGNNTAATASITRLNGYSVRCIADAGSITALTCASASNSGTLTAGVAASGVSSSVPYTGGNGGFHTGQTVTSTGVTGLTATLTAGRFEYSSGSVTYTITGTPSGAGTATFALNIGGQTCNLTRTVQ